MPDDFPRIDVSERGDVSHIFDTIRRHAVQLVKEELKKDGLGQDSKALAACQKAIDQWIKSAQAKLEPNLSVNGMAYNESGEQTQPFDQELSQRVQKLTEQTDELTSRVIRARKTIPTRRAEALQARVTLLQQQSARDDEKRMAIEATFEAEVDQELPQKVSLDRSEEVGMTLDTAVRNIEDLAVTLLEQSSAAQEQARFVKRLRAMSASYA